MEAEAVDCRAVPEPDDPAELHFVNTHTRDSTGSYVVQYPFKDEASPIAETRKQAARRLYQIERRLSRDDELRKQYTQFMDEYEALGHMERVSGDDIYLADSQCFYLAHHAVLRPDSTTTKCRVVFDGSCKDTSNVSLNDRLQVGPAILRDLFTVALRFRQHRYVMTADVEKMFRGIKVAREHQDFQRIVWRDHPNSAVKHYRLSTVTYGLAPSPFLSNRVLKQVALDYQSDFPKASHVLLHDVYVDDVLTGANTIDELIQLKNELIQILSKANLRLRKWSSNCWPLLEDLPEELRQLQTISLEQHNDQCVKVLGLQWNPGNDELMLKVTSPKTAVPTKRLVLSEMSKIYDPLGIVAPIVILFKTLFQESWYHALGWDDELPPALASRWAQYLSELLQLASVRLPRQITHHNHVIELHGFSDASTMACGAVVYSRFLNGTEIQTTLVAAKTRVAPLKSISIPRLELNAAVLLVRLIERIKVSLSANHYSIYLWTDSDIVLHWLSSPPRRWQTFVSNRTSEILATAPRQLWHHVRSQDNPADCASQGMTPSKLIQHDLWWHGQKWLSLPESAWPVSKFSMSTKLDIELLEERKLFQVACCTVNSHSALDVLINKCSSWTHLIRTLAYCRRFLLLLRKGSVQTSYLNATEIAAAKQIIIKHVQFSSFAAEIKHLKELKELPHRSSITQLTPFLDENDILRVGGRLKNATINYNIKHPIILPKHSNASLLLARHIHAAHLHPGVDATFCILRQQYWILGSRSLLRKIIHCCMRCFKQRRTTNHQLMGDLPLARVQANRCFLHCGLDYAGPISIKSFRGRKPLHFKSWFAIFICMSTKAIHIELVSDLTTEAFLAAFKRFVARRGKPSDMYSDNGTTFQGGRRVLSELHESALSQASLGIIKESLANDGTQWHFIPPSAPHFGGLWEAGVRSVKLHLRRVIGDKILTFEELYTLLTQIEAILNSRPLYAISDTGLDPLTPAHFLIGEPYTCVPEPTLLNINNNRLNFWRSIQAMVQGFWKRWHSEYLTSLQQQAKWQQRQPNVKTGDLVVLKEQPIPTAKWILGRVTDAIPGADGLVRVVKVKTSRGEYTRPIVKVVPFPRPEQEVQGRRDVS